MKFNIGIDIEQVSRFKKKNKSFLRKFLSESEISNIKNNNAHHIAGIFCAKEAAIKACSKLQKLNFENIEVLHEKNRQPYVIFKNCKNLSSENIKISISHSKDHAVATAILFIS